MISKFFFGLLAVLFLFVWLVSAISSSKVNYKSEIKNDTSNYSLVKRVRKTAAGSSLNEYYCVYLNEEKGETKAIKVGSYQNCPEEKN